MSTPAKKVPLKKVPSKKTAAKDTAATPATPPTAKKTAAKKTAAKKAAAKKKPVAKKPTATAAKTQSTNQSIKTGTTQATTAQTTTKTVAKSDLIGNTAQEMSTLDRSKAMSLLDKLGNDVADDTFRMGGLLSTIKDKQWYLDDGYEDFKSWVVDNCPFSTRTCDYHIKIYVDLIESGVTWPQVAPLKWSRIKEITGIVNPDNVDEIREIGLKKTVIQLREWVREYNKEESEVSDAPVDTEWSTMNFKVHADQRETIEAAMTKAMDVLETDSKPVGIEHICLDYLSGGNKKKPNATMLKPVVKAAGALAAAEMIENLWPNLAVKIEKMGDDPNDDSGLPSDSEGQVEEEAEVEEESDPEVEAESESDDMFESEEEEVVAESEEDEPEYDEEGNLIEYEEVEVEVDEDGNEIEYEEEEVDYEEEEPTS